METKTMKIKWWNELAERDEYGYAVYGWTCFDTCDEEYYISFNNNDGAFEMLRESDIEAEMLRAGETMKDLFDDIWSELEVMAKETDDGITDVTNYHLE